MTLSNRILSADSELKVPPISLVLFFVIFGLLSGLILREVNKKIRIPYTPILLVLGLLTSLAGKGSIIGQAASLVADIDPSGILLIFIPIIIFEASLKADWHIFKRCLNQILLLAGPGLIISFVLTAIAMKLLLGYDDEELSWSSALMFGAILAATDPVSIVARLKELGAPLNFSIIVEGESLLNDGTGMVFFIIFANLAKGKDINLNIEIISFFILCFGGVALGLLFGVITSFWLKRISRDSVLSTSIIFVASYLLFWVTETFKVSFTSEIKVGASGIIALCTLGLYLSAFAKIRISNKIEGSLHSCIEWTQYVSETLIFILTGILVGKVLFHSEQTITAWDWIKILIFFVLINVIRGLLVLLLSPLLNRNKYKMNRKEMIVLSYAGLRGALGLILALIVHGDEENFSRRTRELILFYVAGTAALTILVNGTTIGVVMKKFNVIKECLSKEKIFSNFISEIKKHRDKDFEELREKNQTAAICDWEEIKNYSNLSINAVLDRQLLVKSMPDLFLQAPRSQESYFMKMDDEELYGETRFVILRIIKRLIWQRCKEGKLEKYGADVLNKAVDVSLDDPQAKISVFEFLYLYFVKLKYLEIFAKFVNVPLIGSFFKEMIVHHMAFIYDVTTSIIDIIEELKGQAGELPIPGKTVQVVVNELEENKTKAISYLNKMEGQFLGITKYVTTKRYINKLLLSQRKLITRKYKMGAIETKEYNSLMEIIDKKILNLPKLIKVKWETPTFSSLVVSFPLFSTLSHNQIERLNKSSKRVELREGKVLFGEGELFDGVYLIMKGEVEIKYKSNNYIRKGAGNLISLSNLVMLDNKSGINCRVSQNGEAQKFDLRVLREIMQENPAFEGKVYKGALGYLRFMKPEKNSKLVRMNDEQIKLLVKNAEIVRFVTGEIVPLSRGGFVLKGSLKAKKVIYDEYSVVQNNVKTLIAQAGGLMIKFQKSGLETKKDDCLSPILEDESERQGEQGFIENKEIIDKELVENISL